MPKCKCIKTLFNDKQQYVPVVSPNLAAASAQEEKALQMRAEIDEINADILDPSIDEDIDDEEESMEAEMEKTFLASIFGFGSSSDA